MLQRRILGAVLCGAVSVACGGGGGGGGDPDESLTCGAGTEEVDGMCVAVDLGGGSGGSSSGGASGTTGSNGGSASGGTSSSDSGGTSGTDAGGTSSSNAGGASTTDAGGTSGTDAGGTTGNDVGGAGGSVGSGASGGTTTDAGGVGGTDAGGTDAGGTEAGGTEAGGTDAGGTDAGGMDAGGTGGTGGGASTGGTGGGGTGGDDGISTEPFDCGSRDVTGATEVSGVISVDTTWSGLVHVVGDVSVRNEATLSIEPGTKIIVGLGYEIDFGWEGSHPTLLAEGTPEAPILFCGETDVPGYWKSLSFQEGVEPGSVLRNVLIQEAGSEDVNAAAALVVNGPVLLEGVQVVDSGGTGVSAAAFGAGSRVLRVHDSLGMAGEATAAGGLDWPEELDFAGNEADVIELWLVDLSESGYFEAKGYGFVQWGAIGLPDDGEGLTFRFGPGMNYAAYVEGLDLGLANVLVEGTEEAPTTFQGRTTVRQGTLQHAEFEDLTLLQPTTLQNVALERLVLDEDGGFTAESSGNRGLGTSPDVQVKTQGCVGANTLPADTELPPGGVITLACEPGDVPVSLPNLGGEYWLDSVSAIGGASVPDGSHLTLEADAVAGYSFIWIEPGGTLTLEAGAQLKGGYGIIVEGTLDAQGEAGAPVLFGPDDDGWAGVEAWDGATVVIDHAVLDKGGSGAEAALIAEVPVTITNSTISNSAQWGILHDESDTTDYAESNTFINNLAGDIGEL